MMRALHRGKWLTASRLAVRCYKRKPASDELQNTLSFHLAAQSQRPEFMSHIKHGTVRNNECVFNISICFETKVYLLGI